MCAHTSAGVRLQSMVKVSGAVAALLWPLEATLPSAQAQTFSDDATDQAWEAGAINHAQDMREFPDADRGAQPTPSIIPQFETDADATGLVATFNRMA